MHTILAQHENNILRNTADEISIEAIATDRIQNLIADMKSLLAREEYGVALAAPQVGESVQLFVVSGRALARNKRNAPDEPQTETSKKISRKTIADQVYINPVLIKMSRGKTGKHEGCLSIRGKWGIVPRAEKATVTAYDEHGIKFTRGASGFLAHIFQHEMDHLAGVLYIDKATEVYDDTGKDDAHV